MKLLDTHSHIYLEDFDSDREEMLQRAEKEGIVKVCMPAIDSATHDKMLKIATQFEGRCFSMIGLHPCSVKENYAFELKIAEEHLQERKFYGIGETGLDYYWDLTFKKEQAISFQQQIEWALHYDLPVVIHSRNSIDDCIEIISENQKGNLKGVFHCFSGSLQQAKQIIDLGFYLGIGGVLTYKNSGLDKVMTDLDLNNVILETDAPYLTPVPFRGKRNECSYLKYVVEKLSEIKSISKEEIAEVTTSNAMRLFNI
jgi:TatD DNase family protein